MKTLAFHLSNTKRIITNVHCYVPSIKNYTLYSLYSLKLETVKIPEKILDHKRLQQKLQVLYCVKVIFSFLACNRLIEDVSV